VISIVQALFLCLHLTSPAAAAPPDAAWLEKPAQLTMIDMLNLYSVVMSNAAVWDVDDLKQQGIEAVNFHLVDAEGKSHIEIVFEERMVVELQREPPGKQTAALQELHGIFSTIFNEIAEDISGQGLFERITGVTSPLDEEIGTFLASREPADMVLSIGFEHGSNNHLYATVTSAGVTFDPDCPVAEE
jgi:hypothetical protein